MAGGYWSTIQTSYDLEKARERTLSCGGDRAPAKDLKDLKIGRKIARATSNGFNIVGLSAGRNSAQSSRTR